MKDFFVYILKCNDGSFYIGHTDDIDERISKHKNGFYEGYTKTRLPVEVVFTQQFATRDEAFNAERQIKGWSRAKKKAFISNDWNGLKNLSKRKKKQ